MTEDWVARNLYCPNCGNPNLCRSANNSRACDFHCETCSEQFELKSARRFGRQIVNGAYDALSRRVLEQNNPNLILLRIRKGETSVDMLQLIPRQFFTPAIIVKRKPLSTSARRAGWIGCNILLDGIPQAGRIATIHDGAVIPTDVVRAAWARIQFLRDVQVGEPRGWLLATMQIVEAFGNRVFTLAEVYQRKANASCQFPENKHVEAKLRQQLQILRDRGFVEFLGGGRYRNIASRSCI